MFEDIRFNDDYENPPQRVEYREGIITIYLKYPAVSRYLGANGRGATEPQGSLMVAELVAEAYCRDIARRLLKERPVVPSPEAYVDNFNRILEEIRRRDLPQIHAALVVG